MTFEQLDRSIDADSDSDDDLAEQAHLYRRKAPSSPVPHLINTTTNTRKVATERAKGKDPAPPTSTSPPSLANLSLDTAPAKPPRPAAPPRPSARKPPVAPAPAARQAAPPSDEEEEDEDEDENDPFADRNAVATPHVERGEPRW